MSLILGLGLATAQQAVPSTTATAPKTAKVNNTKTSKPTNSTTGTKMKKDGTPDRRYKENKKLKKDGTPDRRYKQNK